MTLSERMTASEMAELRDINRQRDERLDARIDKLESAIGEFISRSPKPGE